MTQQPDKPTPERIDYEFEQAQKEQKAAELQLAEGYLEGAISSAYYACFHAARAVLYSHGSMPTTHRGVMTEFQRLFVKSGALSETWSQILGRQRVERQLADYSAYAREVTKSETAELVGDARRFVTEMARLLKS